TVIADRQRVKPQLRQRITQLPQRFDPRIASGHFAERLVTLIERSVRVSWPSHTVALDIVSEARRAPMRLVVLEFIDAERCIECADKLALDITPLCTQP